MNKVFVAAVIVAIAFTCLGNAEAAEAVKLQVGVTFAVDPDLQRVKALESEARAIADKASQIYAEASKPDINGDGVINDLDIALRKEAILRLDELNNEYLEKIKGALREILMRRPDLAYQIEAVISFVNLVQTKIGDYIEKLKAMLELISIGLNNPEWKIENLSLNEKVNNAAYPYYPFAKHIVKNSGNVAVSVGIAILQASIRMGDQPGPDQMAMLICADGYGEGSPIRFVDDYRPVTKHLGPNGTKQVPLVLYSPTSVSSEIQGADVVLELVARPAVIWPNE